MNFTNTQVMNFEGAFRGLRNPLESWAKSDSYFGINSYNYDYALQEVATEWVQSENNQRLKNEEDPFSRDDDSWYESQENYMDWLEKEGVLRIGDEDVAEFAYLGPKDLNLAQRMIRAGSSDRKFLRQILVSVDITAPLYWQNSFCQ